MPLNALDRHLALIGFMGAGKTTTAAALQDRLARPVVDVDTEIEARYRESIPEIFEHHGEPRLAAARGELGGARGDIRA